MEWSWFKQCLTAWQTLTPEESRELKDFSHRHTYQANARFAQACRISTSADSDLSWHLPDRSALFYAHQAPHEVKGERGPQTEHESIPALSRQITAVLGISNSSEPRSKRKPLPVYARPMPAALQTGADLSSMNSQGLSVEIFPSAMSKREPRESPSPAGLGAGEPQEELSAAERQPVMDRFDKNLALGHESDTSHRESSQRNSFLAWLNRLASSSPVKELPLAVDADAPREERNPLLPVSQSAALEPFKEGKKKKKKKKTKQLVKASVKKNEDVATETLARLLALQGHDEEALDMYERLKLLHPEKKATFAAQIEIIKSKRKDP